MTYSSRNFLISWGTGSDDRAPPRASNRLASAMMSLQTSTHSSQMNTVGPAMSLRTSFWSLLQNEQRRISPSPVFLTMVVNQKLPANSYQLPAPSPPAASARALDAGSWDQAAGNLHARLRITSSIIPYSLPWSGP